jgi:hypothetical protein
VIDYRACGIPQWPPLRIDGPPLDIAGKLPAACKSLAEEWREAYKAESR